MTTADMLRPAEAAVVARVNVRDVNRAVDEHILPEGFVTLGDGRRILASACALIAFYFESANRLTADERLSTITQAASRLRRLGSLSAAALALEDWTVRDEFMSIDLGPFIRRASARMDRLAAARALVITDPEVLGGTPVIRGTRVPVHDVAASIAAGIPVDRILAAYPSLDTDSIELAALYAEANPVRGRPRSAGALPSGAEVMTDHRVRRRRHAG